MKQGKTLLTLGTSHPAATQPNQLWVADFTHVASWRGFLCVAFVIDVFSRRIVGWRAHTTMRTELVLDAFEQALHYRKLDGRLIDHTDRGSQYVAMRYKDCVLAAGAAPSVGSVGAAHDNAMIESVIGLYTTEVIYRRGLWRGFEDVEYATLEWVAWFNACWNRSVTFRRRSSRSSTTAPKRLNSSACQSAHRSS